MYKKFLTADDVVVCKECGRGFQCITITHLRKHSMTIKEYVLKHKIYGGNARSRGWKLKHQAIAAKRYALGELYANPHAKDILAKGRECLKNIDMAAVHSKTDKNWWAQFTPEQRKAEMKARWGRIYKRRPELKDALRKRARILGLGRRKKTAGVSDVAPAQDA